MFFIKEFTFKLVSVVLAIFLLTAQSFNVYVGGLNIKSFSIEDSEFSYDEGYLNELFSDLDAEPFAKLTKN